MIRVLVCRLARQGAGREGMEVGLGLGEGSPPAAVCSHPPKCKCKARTIAPKEVSSFRFTGMFIIFIFFFDSIRVFVFFLVGWIFSWGLGTWGSSFSLFFCRNKVPHVVAPPRALRRAPGQARGVEAAQPRRSRRGGQEDEAERKRQRRREK